MLATHMVFLCIMLLPNYIQLLRNCHCIYEMNSKLLEFFCKMPSYLGTSLTAGYKTSIKSTGRLNWIKANRNRMKRTISHHDQKGIPIIKAHLADDTSYSTFSACFLCYNINVVSHNKDSDYHVIDQNHTLVLGASIRKPRSPSVGWRLRFLSQFWLGNIWIYLPTFWITQDLRRSQ
jgi:hypothetical protein